MNSVFSLPLADPVHGSRSFLAGPENAVVNVVHQAVMQNDRTRMPLVLWGSTGVGKTFLAEGLAETWRSQPVPTTPPRKVIELSGVAFARQYADAVDTDSLSSFRQSFRSAGLILIDNLSPLCDKPAASREFCYLLDRWLGQQQVVLCTSLIAPSLLSEASLASRLCAGLSVCIAPPEPSAQRALLEHFTQVRAVPMTANLLDHLTERLQKAATNTLTPRSLHAAILQLESTAHLTNAEISTEFIDVTFPTSETAAGIEIKKILSFVAKRFGVSLVELRSSSRRQTLVRARGVVALLARLLAAESYQAIGTALGNRDHSTIHHAVEKVQQSMQSDIPFASFVQNLQEELQALITTTVKSNPKSILGKRVVTVSPAVASLSPADKQLTRLS